MAKKKIIILTSVFLVFMVCILCIVGNYMNKDISNQTETTEIGSAKDETQIDDENLIYIKRSADVIPINDVNVMMELSDAILIGTIVKKEVPVFEEFVDEELKQRYISQGYGKEYYSDIYTYYEISVEELLSGECNKKIIKYKALGGRIDNVILKPKDELQVGDRCIFCVEKIDETYINVFGDGAFMRITENGNIKSGFLGDFTQKISSEKQMKECINNAKNKEKE